MASTKSETLGQVSNQPGGKSMSIRNYFTPKSTKREESSLEDIGKKVDIQLSDKEDTAKKSTTIGSNASNNSAESSIIETVDLESQKEETPSQENECEINDSSNSEDNSSSDEEPGDSSENEDTKVEACKKNLISLFDEKKCKEAKFEKAVVKNGECSNNKSEDESDNVEIITLDHSSFKDEDQSNKLLKKSQSNIDENVSTENGKNAPNAFTFLMNNRKDKKIEPVEDSKPLDSSLDEFKLDKSMKGTSKKTVSKKRKSEASTPAVVPKMKKQKKEIVESKEELDSTPTKDQKKNKQTKGKSVQSKGKSKMKSAADKTSSQNSGDSVEDEESVNSNITHGDFIQHVKDSKNKDCSSLEENKQQTDDNIQSVNSPVIVQNNKKERKTKPVKTKGKKRKGSIESMNTSVSPSNVVQNKKKERKTKLSKTKGKKSKATTSNQNEISTPSQNSVEEEELMDYSDFLQYLKDPKNTESKSEEASKSCEAVKPVDGNDEEDINVVDVIENEKENIDNQKKNCHVELAPTKSSVPDKPNAFTWLMNNRMETNTKEINKEELEKSSSSKVNIKKISRSKKERKDSKEKKVNTESNNEDDNFKESEESKRSKKKKKNKVNVNEEGLALKRNRTPTVKDDKETLKTEQEPKSTSKTKKKLKGKKEKRKIKKKLAEIQVTESEVDENSNKESNEIKPTGKSDGIQVEEKQQLNDQTKTENSEISDETSGGRRRSTRIQAQAVVAASKLPDSSDSEMEGAQRLQNKRKTSSRMKTKNASSKHKKPTADESDSDEISVEVVDSDSDIEVVSSKSKVPTKLAPLFIKRKKGKESPVKVVEDPVISQARREFLSSGVPESLRRQAEALLQLEVQLFPEISHVQQRDEGEVWNLLPPPMVIQPEGEVEVTWDATGSGGILIDKQHCIAQFPVQFNPPSSCSIGLVEAVMKDLKTQLGALPITTMFTSLVNRKFLAEQESISLTTAVQGLPEQGTTSPEIVPLDDEVVQVKTQKQKRRKLSKSASKVEPPTEAVSKQPDIPCHGEVYKEDRLWTDKYRPRQSCEVVGNEGATRKLKSWLQLWKERFARESNKAKHTSKRKKRKDMWAEDDSDFTSNSGSDSEGDSEEELGVCNSVMIVGPAGCGKTACVYALAEECGFKVFEVNSSSKRSGKQVLAQLQEATQSYQVSKNSEKNPLLRTKTSSQLPSPKPETSLKEPKETEVEPSKPKKLPTSFANFFTRKVSEKKEAVNIENKDKNNKHKVSKETSKDSKEKNGVKKMEEKIVEVVDEEVKGKRGRPRNGRNQEVRKIESESDEVFEVVNNKKIKFVRNDERTEKKMLPKKSSRNRIVSDSDEELIEVTERTDNQRNTRRKEAKKVEIKKIDSVEIKDCKNEEINCEKITTKPTSDKASLIFFEDVNIVFDEDEGFWGAVSTFMNTTKRPIILTTNDPYFSERGRLRSKFDVLKFRHPNYHHSAAYLKMLCLLENVEAELWDMYTLVESSKGDVRKSMLQAQLWVHSGGKGMSAPPGSPSQGIEPDLAAKDNKDCLKLLAEDLCKEESVAAEDSSVDVWNSWKNSSRVVTGELCFTSAMGGSAGELDSLQKNLLSLNKRILETYTMAKLPLLYNNFLQLLPFNKVEDVSVTIAIQPTTEIDDDTQSHDSCFTADSQSDTEDFVITKRNSSVKFTRILKSDEEDEEIKSEKIDEVESKMEIEEKNEIVKSDQVVKSGNVKSKKAVVNLVNILSAALDNYSVLDCMGSYFVSMMDDCSENVRLFSKDCSELGLEISTTAEVLNVDLCRTRLAGGMPGEGNDDWPELTVLDSNLPSSHRLHRETIQQKRRAEECSLINAPVLDYLSDCGILSRSTQAMDYLPTLRILATAEEHREITNVSRRRRRFYHHLNEFGLKKSQLKQLANYPGLR